MPVQIGRHSELVVVAPGVAVLSRKDLPSHRALAAGYQGQVVQDLVEHERFGVLAAAPGGDEHGSVNVCPAAHASAFLASSTVSTRYVPVPLSPIR